MCSPDFFEIVYSINPWMTGEKVNKEKATWQWNTLKNEIEKAGGGIQCLSLNI
jgi:N-dimethylarginine dimethylaminohydrolase